MSNKYNNFIVETGRKQRLQNHQKRFNSENQIFKLLFPRQILKPRKSDFLPSRLHMTKFNTEPRKNVEESVTKNGPHFQQMKFILNFAPAPFQIEPHTLWHVEYTLQLHLTSNSTVTKVNGSKLEIFISFFCLCYKRFIHIQYGLFLCEFICRKKNIFNVPKKEKTFVVVELGEIIFSVQGRKKLINYFSLQQELTGIRPNSTNISFRLRKSYQRTNVSYELGYPGSLTGIKKSWAHPNIFRKS